MDAIEVLTKAVSYKASDVHITTGKPPMLRILGSITPMPQMPPMDTNQCQSFMYSILFEAQRKKLEENLELDTSFSIPNVARFRVNVLYTSRGLEAVLRVISPHIFSPDEIRFTEGMRQLTELKDGLVLVTGPTGSGKSTTLATMVEMINSSRNDHILTIEDPIEYIYESKKSIVRQREVGMNTLSFANALRSALREDPDVILVGEMRDLETIALAITAAETGHLVFATLHTSSAPQTVDRIIDVFPPHQQQQVRTQLATVLKAVISQTLVPLLEERSRIAAREIMYITPAIANLMREGKTHMIVNILETSQKEGMISLDKDLELLVKQRKISVPDALARAASPATMKKNLAVH